MSYSSLPQEVQVSVCFSPPSAPLTSEGSLMIHVEPNGPNYEMKLRGTATDDERHRDGYVTWWAVTGSGLEHPLLVARVFCSAADYFPAVRGFCTGEG